MKTIEQPLPVDKPCTPPANELKVSSLLETDCQIHGLLAKLLADVICKHYKDSATQTHPVKAKVECSEEGYSWFIAINGHDGCTAQNIHPSVARVENVLGVDGRLDSNQDVEDAGHVTRDESEVDVKQRDTTGCASDPGPAKLFSRVRSRKPPPGSVSDRLDTCHEGQIGSKVDQASENNLCVVVEADDATSLKADIHAQTSELTRQASAYGNGHHAHRNNTRSGGLHSTCRADLEQQDEILHLHEHEGSTPGRASGGLLPACLEERSSSTVGSEGPHELGKPMSLQKQQRRSRAKKAKIARDREKKRIGLAERCEIYDSNLVNLRHTEALCASIVTGSCQFLIQTQIRIRQNPAWWLGLRRLEAPSAFDLKALLLLAYTQISNNLQIQAAYKRMHDPAESEKQLASLEQLQHEMNDPRNQRRPLGSYGAWDFTKVDHEGLLQQCAVSERLLSNAWDVVVDAREWADSMLALQVQLARHPQGPSVSAEKWLAPRVQSHAQLISEFMNELIMLLCNVVPSERSEDGPRCGSDGTREEGVAGQEE